MLRLEKASGPSPRARFRWGLVRVPINTCKDHFRSLSGGETWRATEPRSSRAARDMDRAMLERSLAALRQVRGNAAPGRALSPVEARELFEAAAGDQNHAGGARDAALLALAYGAGLRRAELAAARLADLDGTRSEFTARAAGSGSPTLGRTDAPPPCPPGSRSGGRRTGRSSGP